MDLARAQRPAAIGAQLSREIGQRNPIDHLQRPQPDTWSPGCCAVRECQHLRRAWQCGGKASPIVEAWPPQEFVKRRYIHRIGLRNPPSLGCQLGAYDPEEFDLTRVGIVGVQHRHRLLREDRATRIANNQLRCLAPGVLELILRRSIDAANHYTTAVFTLRCNHLMA